VTTKRLSHTRKEKEEKRKELWRRENSSYLPGKNWELSFFPRRRKSAQTHKREGKGPPFARKQERSGYIGKGERLDGNTQGVDGAHHSGEARVTRAHLVRKKKRERSKESLRSHLVVDRQEIFGGKRGKKQFGTPPAHRRLEKGIIAYL